MAGTSESNKQGYKTLLKRRGKRFISKRASKAGSKGKADGVVKGFAARPELASELGRKGAAKRWAK